jgi:hypothetical protein
MNMGLPNVFYLTTLLIVRLYRVGNRVMNAYGALLE